MSQLIKPPLILILLAVPSFGQINQLPQEEQRFPEYTLEHALGNTGITDLDTKGIRQALEEFQFIDPEVEGQVEKLAKQLDLDSFSDRQVITRDLLALLREKPGARATLNELQNSLETPEARRGIHWLLSRPTEDSLMRLRGLLEWIRLEETPRILGDLERILPSFLDPALQEQLLLCADLSTAADIPRLNAWTESNRPLLRMAAIRGYLALGPKAYITEFEALVEDPDDRVRLDAALALGRAGSSECLRPLLALAKHPDHYLRCRAGYALNQLADKWLGFLGDAEAKRELTLKKMKTLNEANITLPLSLPESVTGAPGCGRRLVTAGGSDPTIRIFGPDGKLQVKKETNFRFIGDVIPMGGGNYFLAVSVDWNNERNFIWNENNPGKFKRIGRATPDYPCPNIISNGHVILCGNGITELGKDFKHIRHFDLPETGRMAWRTVFGTTLVALRQSIQEYDPKGNLLWEKEFPQDFVVCCQGLPNGNVMIVLDRSNRLVEINNKKEIVWEWSIEKDGRINDSLWDTTRLDNGNYLIKTDSAALELSPGGRVLWFKRLGSAGQVRKTK